MILLFIKELKTYIYLFTIANGCVCVLWVQVYKEDICPSSSSSGSGCTHGRIISGKGFLFLEPPELILIIYRVFPPFNSTNNSQVIPLRFLGLNIIVHVKSLLYTHYIIAIIKKEHPIRWPSRVFTYKHRHVIVILFRTSTSTSSTRVNIYLYIYQKSKVC